MRTISPAVRLLLLLLATLPVVALTFSPLLFACIWLDMRVTPAWIVVAYGYAMVMADKVIGDRLRSRLFDWLLRRAEGRR
jgi:hypothetical protein